MTPRHRRLGVLVGIALLFPLIMATGSYADPLADKRAEAARIQEELERKGEQVSILAERSNRAQLKVSEVEVSLAKTQAEVARSDQRLQAVRARLAQAAVLAYVHGLVANLPTERKLIALCKGVNGPPTKEQAAQMQAYSQRLGKAGTHGVALVSVAMLLMLLGRVFV